MRRFQCSCGFVKEETPRFGDTIVSVSHLHRSVRLDGSATIVRMEEIAELASASDGAAESAKAA